MRPAPAIAWTVAGAMLAAAVLESLPACGPPPMPLDQLLERAAAWADALLRAVIALLGPDGPRLG